MSQRMPLGCGRTHFSPATNHFNKDLSCLSTPMA